MQTDAILLVDDNSDDVLLTLRAFKKHNFMNEIVVAGDGSQALELLLPTDGSAPLRPAIVLLDLNMPKLGGLEVLRRLRAAALTRMLPVVMLTTSGEESDIARSYECGANSFVRKALTYSEFLDTAKILGDYWLGVNEQPPGRDQ